LVRPVTALEIGMILVVEGSREKFTPARAYDEELDPQVVEL